MSKSLGNIILIREILGKYSADVMRLLVLQTHYRNPIDFGPEALDEARRACERLENCLFALEAFPEAGQPGATAERTPRELELAESILHSRKAFEEAMDDDFNTARALGAIFELVKDLNTYLDEQGRQATPAAPYIAAQGRCSLLGLCHVLGLFSPEGGRAEVSSSRAAEEGAGLPDSGDLIELLLDIRSRARERKDWETADMIRSRLLQMGIRVDDLRGGERWKFVGPAPES